MPYPFTPKLENLEKTSFKLKIISVAEGKPISKIIVEIVDDAYEQYDRERLKKAITEVSKDKPEERN